tara:strand:+ start:16538 stop:16693 length:156 start_codon:yes stop_codon:yes gene_type:complete
MLVKVPELVTVVLSVPEVEATVIVLPVLEIVAVVLADTEPSVCTVGKGYDI